MKLQINQGWRHGARIEIKNQIQHLNFNVRGGTKKNDDCDMHLSCMPTGIVYMNDP